MAPKLDTLHPLVLERALGKGPLRAVIAGHALALFRGEHGRPAAVDDRCPHRFAPLSAGHVRPDGRIACPYHGWSFDSAGRGLSPSQPQLACETVAYDAIARFGVVWGGAGGASRAALEAIDAGGLEPIAAACEVIERPLADAFERACARSEAILGRWRERARGVEAARTLRFDVPCVITSVRRGRRALRQAVVLVPESEHVTRVYTLTLAREVPRSIARLAFALDARATIPPDVGAAFERGEVDRRASIAAYLSPPPPPPPSQARKLSVARRATSRPAPGIPTDFSAAVPRFFHPVLPANELPRGARRNVILAGEAFTVARGADGAVSLSGLSASRHLRAVDLHGYLWIGGTRARLPALDYAAEGYEQVGASGTRFRAPLHVAFDNFSEDEHTPWVHSFLGWRESAAGRIHFEASSFDDRTEVYYRAPQRPHPLTPTILVRWGDDFHNRWVTRFEPVHTVYTLHWSDPESGKRRPVTSRFAIYFVPETATTTWLHVFAFAKIEPAFRMFMPIVRRWVPRIGASEIDDDARFIPTVAGTPAELKGMRLGRYDKPIIQNHKLLARIYAQIEPSLLASVS